MSLSPRLLWLLLLPALALIWWLAAQHDSRQTLRLPPDPGCDVAAKPCRLPLPEGGFVSLALSPSPPQLMKPMTVTVSLDANADRVWLDLVGLNMDMGPNRGELRRAANGLWQGAMIIPICGSARMDWEARVMVVTEGRTLEAPFTFVTRP